MCVYVNVNEINQIETVGLKPVGLPGEGQHPLPAAIMRANESPTEVARHKGVTAP